MSTSTPHNNNQEYTERETEYIQKTAEEFDFRLQRLGLAWPRHEIQILLCKHFNILAREREIDRLKKAIKDQDDFSDGFCIVCLSHRPKHSKGCPMADMED
jgi:hypothetical protein